MSNIYKCRDLFCHCQSSPEHAPLKDRYSYLADELEWFAEEHVADSDEARRHGTDRIPFTAREIRETMALLDAAAGDEA